MTRRLARIVMAIALTALACSHPTDLCSCSPPMEEGSAYVIGSLRDASDAPVAGARIGLAAAHPQAGAPRTIIFSVSISTTNAAGEFRGTVRESRTGPLTLYAAVLRPGGSDTLRFEAGSVTFRSPPVVPDTVNIMLRLP